MNQAEQDLMVLSAQAGNIKAFDLLYRAYQKQLLGFAYKISHDHELTRDAVQEAWIKAARTLKKLNDPRAFKSWIYRLVRWKVTDLVRQRARHLETSEPFNEELAITETDKLSDEKLSKAIAELPLTEKQMIHLFYLDEMKIAEISMILEIPIGTVKSRLNRARELLRTHFQPLENNYEY